MRAATSASTVTEELAAPEGLADTDVPFSTRAETDYRAAPVTEFTNQQIERKRGNVISDRINRGIDG